MWCKQRRWSLLAALVAAVGCGGEMSYDPEAAPDAGDEAPGDDPADDDEDDPGAELTVNVDGDGGWLDTGMDVTRETLVTVLASGAITFNDAMTETGPGGYGPDDFDGYNLVTCANHAGLIGRIDTDGEPHFIGGDTTYSATATGRLYLGVNDDDPGNNAGAFAVRVSTAQPSSVIGRHSVTVPATQTWTDSGIDLNGDEILAITASGEMDNYTGDPATNGPGGKPDSVGHGANVIACANHATLLGRVGATGAPFEVGLAYSARVKLAGRLYLGINDTVTTDNAGKLGASVTLIER
jgi:hypothetical protein